MKRKFNSYIKSHNIINRIYDMLDYLDFFDEEVIQKEMKKSIKDKLESIYYLETLAKYFDDMRKKYKENIELRCNLKDLIADINYLKQFLV